MFPCRGTIFLLLVLCILQLDSGRKWVLNAVFGQPACIFCPEGEDFKENTAVFCGGFGGLSQSTSAWLSCCKRDFAVVLKLAWRRKAWRSQERR